MLCKEEVIETLSWLGSHLRTHLPNDSGDMPDAGLPDPCSVIFAESAIYCILNAAPELTDGDNTSDVSGIVRELMSIFGITQPTRPHLAARIVSVPVIPKSLLSRIADACDSYYCAEVQ